MRVKLSSKIEKETHKANKRLKAKKASSNQNNKLTENGCLNCSSLFDRLENSPFSKLKQVTHMKPNTVIAEQYSKYLKTIQQDRAELIPSSFRKFITFITEQADENLQTILYFDCVYNTIKLVKKTHLSLKSCAEDWNSNTISTFFNTINQLNSNILKGGGVNDSDAYKTMTYRLFQLIKFEEDPSLQLYMYLKHSETKDGETTYSQFKTVVREILNAQSDDEIQAIVDKAWKG